MSAPDLEALRAAWRAVATYTVYRSEASDSPRNKKKTVLHRHLSYDEAVQAMQKAQAQLMLEPGYRAHVMSRALILMELERPGVTGA